MSGQAGAPSAENRAEVICFLSDTMSDGRSYPVERLEAHGNFVFLCGPDVWKIKRPMRFPYMDFSSVEKRQAACERGVAINRRFSSNLHIGCVPITRSAGGALGMSLAWRVIDAGGPAAKALRLAASQLGLNLEAP